MHDGKDACAHEIIAAGGDRIGKQPTDMGILPAREARRARRNEAVDVAALQEFGNGDVLWRVLHAHAGWELDGDLLRPARVLDPAPHPDNVGRLHAVVVFQNDAGPHAGGWLLFPPSDPPSFSV